MTSFETGAVTNGRSCIYPGLRYEVIQAFEDDDKITHPPGETWTFLGYEKIKFAGGYILHVESSEGRHLKFRMSPKRLSVVGPPTAFDELERYVRGPQIDWSAFSQRLSNKAINTISRYWSELEKTLTSGEALLWQIGYIRAGAQLSRDDMRGATQADVDELSELYREVLILLQEDSSHSS